MGFWKTFDLNKDNQITAEEFNFYLERLPDDSVNEDKLKQSFRLFDMDDSGRIELEELKAIFTQLGRGKDDELIKSVLTLHGISPEKGIEFEDFLAIFSNPSYV
ncbi:unnamed protein product [Protopolystoma xenopodis]|uniref:EF-hand domain-containing protein n=1 Tax=Protopolystoma xenopodis TaxID=117903 RepID=A0A448XS54_9PLAT|nr:unnamed protein product [Protopolystoma xenopodis]